MATYQHTPFKAPRVIKHHQKIHLSYELPHRVYDAAIYPIPAPNDSTVILYAHDRGLRILWRGGRRRRRNRAPPTGRPNGTHSAGDIIDLISDDEGPPPARHDHAGHGHENDDDYETEEEEQDPDCPYPSLIDHLDIEFGSEHQRVAALSLAIPSIAPSAVLPPVLQRHAVVAVASGDGKLRLLQVPLSPPSEGQGQQRVNDIVKSAIELVHTGPLPATIAVKYCPAEHQRPDTLSIRRDDLAGHILVASASRALSVWAVAVDTAGDIDNHTETLRKVNLPTPPSTMSFHPSSRSSQLLLVEASGAVRIYDPHGTSLPRRRPDSSDSMLGAPPTLGEGKWVMAFHTPFQASKHASEVGAGLARRTRILDSRWVLGGRAILVLLDDGQWGLWDIAPSQQDKAVESFTISGFLGTVNAAETSDSSKVSKTASKLAPMTPNTRRVKNDELFRGETKVVGVAARGGISVARTGAADESVVLWYGSEIYAITSMHSFWQRSNTIGGGFGSLYSPGLAHITDVHLMNEGVSSISLFPSKTAGSGIGQMNTQRDLLVSADHRIIVLQTLRSAITARRLFDDIPARTARPVSHDQQMLHIGGLDIDGVDRMLDSMKVAPRKVGFAAR